MCFRELIWDSYMWSMCTSFGGGGRWRDTLSPTFGIELLRLITGPERYLTEISYLATSCDSHSRTEQALAAPSRSGHPAVGEGAGTS